ncbi:MAG TPA: endonuclease [Chitinophagales bacterium]|nr:endonuclease [Chitinophagales bacterium]
MKSGGNKLVVFCLPLAGWLVSHPCASAQDTTIAGNYGTVTFSNVKPYGFTVSFQSAVSNADGFLCLRSRQPMDTAFLSQHLNQSLPERGSGLGLAKVFQSSAPALFNVREVVENTDYYFAIVPYRAVSVSAFYFVKDSSLFARVKSQAANPGSYYTGFDFDSPDMLNELTQYLQAHIFINYAAYKNTMVPVIFERDTVSQQHVVNCEYSGETKIYSGSFDFVALRYSREHMLARSWMPTGGATTAAEGSDYHNLALTNLDSVNSIRSNFPFGEVEQATYSFLECKLGTDSGQTVVFEPRDEKKGDVARALFYMMVCYNGLGGNWGLNHLLSSGTLQNVNVLLNWHFSDLPDAFEKTKHEYIYSLQRNRNPFIDFPVLASCIDFGEIIKSGICPTVEIRDITTPIPVTIYPNPADGLLIIETQRNGQLKKIIVCDVHGRMVGELEYPDRSDRVEFPLGIVYQGFFFVKIILKDGTVVNRKVMVK